VPESKGRKAAEIKAVSKRRAEASEKHTEKAKRSPKLSSNRAWVPPTFITVGLLGVLWLVVYYIAGASIPFMSSLGTINVVIGMGLLAASFGIATLWT
jgi:hypothetical protein